jgi:AcrR family transcriptional regulator
MKEAGVPPRTFYRWLKDKRYIDYINSKLDQYTDSELSEVWKALIMQCKRGNIQAIKLFFEMKELHPNTKVW